MNKSAAQQMVQPVAVPRHRHAASGLIRSTGLTLLAVLSLSGAITGKVHGADRFADVVIKTDALRGGVYMLTGAGGNIGVLSTADGMLMVDDQFAPLAPRIRKALDEIAAGGPRFILNTHYHGDHTGGNAEFAAGGATILAHHNVRMRLLSDTPAAGLPVITYEDRVQLHLGEETVEVIHMPRGHTDGDSIVWFRSANVVHMGDMHFNRRFPYVDLDAGGDVRGLTDNIRWVVGQLDSDTLVIPGHGELAKPEDLHTYLDMLERTYEQVRQRVVDEGLDEEAVVKQGLADEWESWGSGFINEERWLRTLYAVVSQDAS